MCPVLLYLLLAPSLAFVSTISHIPISYGNNLSPIEHFDWRQQGCVSPVKDQGQCLDCWAFSSVANIESQYLRQGYQYILSEQFLLDCNTVGGTCTNDAGVVATFADIIVNLGGVPLASDYRPYNASQQVCPAQKPALINVAGVERLKPGDEEAMARALLEHGPLSAGINAHLMGISPRNPLDIDEPTEGQCPPHDTNHAVLIVGYSVSIDPNGRRVPYWIIKNSWGDGWGDNGYYYLRRGTNACGIAMDVSYATVVV